MMRILTILGGYIVSILGGILVVPAILKALNIPAAKELGVRRAGSYIGVFERFIVFSFIWINQYSAIGLIFAAKSITRFEELKKRDFAEYYLVGTLASISWTLLWGLGVKSVLKILA